MSYKIGVLIATSMNRKEMLFKRSLNSVLNQTYSPDCIVIVDDNNNKDVFNEIHERLQSFGYSNIFYIKNERTPNMSGTGAWNTGINFIKERLGEKAYVAILDDDDNWSESYLKSCVDAIISSSVDLQAIFAYLKRSDCLISSSFSYNDLNAEAFLKGNPGIQGSNMFFKIEALLEIGCFDEALCSCTDRDLLIRFLSTFGNQKIAIINKTLVYHYASLKTVTTNFQSKCLGLDAFYKKYIRRYNYPLLRLSLERSQKLFKYPNSKEIFDLFKSTHIVCITGVCGFIGSAVAKRLIALGYNVIGIDDLSTGVPENIEEIQNSINFNFYNISITDSQSIDAIFSKYSIQYVFHFAALPRIQYAIDFPEKSELANVIGTKNMVNSAVKYNVKQFVFSSSSSVYGIKTKGNMKEEDKNLSPVSLYAKQKLESEKYIAKIEKSGAKTNFIVFRLFNVYGYSSQKINKYSTIVQKWIDSVNKNQAIVINGDGSQSRDFTYIGDVVEAFISCIEFYTPKKQIEIINIGNGQNVKIIDVAQKIQTQLFKNIRINYNKLSYTEPFYTLANNKKAEKLLNWKPTTNITAGIEQTIKQMQSNEKIVIGVAMHNNRKTIRRCILSIIKQKSVKRNIYIVLADDNSTDQWRDEIDDLILKHNTKISIISLNNCDVVKTRNAINEFIKSKLSNVVLVGRLDADDEFANNSVLQKIEKLFDKENPDLILAGNYLRKDDVIINRTNKATQKLADNSYLAKRVWQMTKGIPEAELPSCNLFMRLDIIHPYPNKKSAEDHALLIYYLNNLNKYKMIFAEDIFLTIYNLNGNITTNNKSNSLHQSCRKELYEEMIKHGK